MMLAQSIDSLPSDFWKNFCIALIAIIVVVGIIVGIIATTRQPAPVKLNDDPAIEVRKTPKRFNYELCKEKHGSIENKFSIIDTRLDDHDSEFVRLQTERGTQLETDRKRNQRLMFALGKIAQKLNVDIEPAE